MEPPRTPGRPSRTVPAAHRAPGGAPPAHPARQRPAGQPGRLRRGADARGRGGPQVALGTLYRYFPSKVHLLVATMQDQLEHMHETLRKQPPAGDDPAQRVAETLMRAFRALQREPHLADAMVRALTFADRSVSPEVDRSPGSPRRSSWTRWAGRATRRRAASAVRVIEHTWHSALITWLSGRASIAQVRADLHTAARLLTAG